MTARIIGITSGKGGVGKTVTAINLGLSLYHLGQDVTVVDADTTVPNMGLQLGIYSFPVTLRDVLNGTDTINRSIYTHPSGLKMIPSSISLDSINVDLTGLKWALRGLDGIVLVDSPPGLGNDALSVLDACDEIIVISNPEIQTMANALKVIRVALGMEKTVLGLVVNRSSSDRYDMTADEIKTMCETPILSLVPEDRSIRKSLFEKTPVTLYDPYSRAAIEFRKLACSLIGKNYAPPKNLFINRLAGKIRKMMG